MVVWQIMCHQLNKNKIIESNDNSISFKEINYIIIKHVPFETKQMKQNAHT